MLVPELRGLWKGGRRSLSNFKNLHIIFKQFLLQSEMWVRWACVGCLCGVARETLSERRQDSSCGGAGCSVDPCQLPGSFLTTRQVSLFAWVLRSLLSTHDGLVQSRKPEESWCWITSLMQSTNIKIISHHPNLVSQKLNEG